MTKTVPPQLEELIDERIFNFAQAAQTHYKTNDLVVFLDLMEADAQLQAIPRQHMAESTEVPESLRRKLAAPASEVGTILGSPSQSFWFFVIYKGGNADCVAINASMLAPGGNA